MILTDYFQLVLDYLRDKKIRAFLTILGMVIGVAIIVLLFSLGSAMQNAVSDQFSKMGIKSIRVIPGGLFGPPSGGFGLDINLKNNIESVRGVDYAEPMLSDTASLQFNKETKYVSLTSYDTSNGEKGFMDTNLQISSGRYFTRNDKDSIIIGANVAEKLFKKKVNLKDTLIVDNQPFKVVGIFDKMGNAIDSRIYIPLETAKDLLNKHDIANAFVVQIKEGYNIEDVATDIRAALFKKLKDKDAFQVFTPEQLLKEIKTVLGTIDMVLIAIAIISVIVGSIGIMNSMFTSVLERTREIGVMRAVGATKTDIFLLFLFESGFIGLVGGLIGLGIGISLAYLTGYIVSLFGVTLLSVSVGWELILFSFFFSFFVGALSGTIPAIRAANLQPVDALRYE